MINSLLTIIIPCENSVFELKNTIENIIKQTKIRGTNVLVLDNKSKDGTAEYAAQASSDYSRVLSINVVDSAKEDYVINSGELKSYILWIKPGITFRSPDSVINMINLIMKDENILILTNGKINFFNSYYLKKGKININCLMCKKNDIDLIDYKKDNESKLFPFNKKIGLKKYQIIKGSLSER